VNTSPTVGQVSDVSPFNALAEAEARLLLQSCLAVPRWVEGMLAGRPFNSRTDLLTEAAVRAATLTEAEVAAALARHPRIGERAGVGHDVEFSVGEQSGVDPDDAAVASALEVGNAEYEQRFGRVFLIRAAGRSADDILAAQQRRLSNTPQAELDEVVSQLGEIAVLRLQQIVDSIAPASGPGS
jgi:OHCU decarboxylase